MSLPSSATAASPPHRVAVVGGTFSGNKGAASMLQAVIDRLPGVAGPCTFDVLSAYPQADRREARGGDATIVGWKPAAVIIDLPLAVLAAITRRLGLPAALWLRTPSLRALARADVVADVAGISFVDGRGLVVLAYNVLTMVIPLLLGRRVVKCSQALGPFRERANRFAAGLVLPRLRHVFARGERTAQHLASLGLSNVSPAADLAFALDHRPDETVAGAWPSAGETGGGTGGGTGECLKVALVPSAVVQAYCTKEGIDYAGIMAKLVGQLLDDGGRVALFPHSARPGAGASRSNDLPVCAAIAQRVGSRPGFAFLDDNLSPHQLRALIGEADVLIAARFHAMISGLATCTPLLVTGWSHKYSEVLGQFGLERHQLPYERLSAGDLLSAYRDLAGQREAVRAQIAAALPEVRRSALRNLEGLSDALTS